MNYGLALSGGGAKGAVHAGVLKALEEKGLLPDVVAGTSSGSIVAGCFAAGMSISSLTEEVRYLCRNGRRYFDPDYVGMIRLIPQLIKGDSVSLKGFLKGEKLFAYLCRITKGAKIEEAVRGILIPTVDLYSGRTVVYTNLNGVSGRWKAGQKVAGEEIIWEKTGLLCAAMMASSSFPAVFWPRSLDGRMLTDGGVTYNLPVDLLAAAGTDVIIGVDVGGELEMTDKSSILDVVFRSFSIRGESLERCHAQKDVLILRPRLKRNVGLLEFSAMEEAMEAGYEYTLSKIPAIRKKISAKNIEPF
ncbi:MAG: patatin-like phospholipase family protein [Lachnospiraceae bacterium]